MSESGAEILVVLAFVAIMFFAFTTFTSNNSAAALGIKDAQLVNMSDATSNSIYTGLSINSIAPYVLGLMALLVVLKVFVGG